MNCRGLRILAQDSTGPPCLPGSFPCCEVLSGSQLYSALLWPVLCLPSMPGGVLPLCKSRVDGALGPPTQSSPTLPKASGSQSWAHQPRKASSLDHCPRLYPVCPSVISPLNCDCQGICVPRLHSHSREGCKAQRSDTLLKKATNAPQALDLGQV